MITPTALLPYADILMAAPGALLVLDVRGTVVAANRQAVRLFGYHEADLVGMSLEDLLVDHRIAQPAHPDGQRLPIEGLEHTAMGRRADGATFTIRLDVSHVPNGQHDLFVAGVQDLTHFAAAQERLSRRALRDPLTGLSNRSALLQQLRSALARAGPSRRVGVLYIDLDGFKHVNDTYGHTTGDVVLRETAQRIAHTIRPYDAAARFGGDEFVVLCDRLDDGRAGVDRCMAVAQRIHEAVRQPHALRSNGTDRPDVQVTASTGLSISGTGSQRAHDLVERADRALLSAKRLGRDRIVAAPVGPDAVPHDAAP